MISTAPAAVATGASAGTVTTAAARPPMTMKLWINTKANQVIFAEAGKETIDFLFSILATPVGTFAKLLGEDRAQPPGLSNLYNSVKKMDSTYMKSSGVQAHGLCTFDVRSPDLLQHIRLPRSPATMVSAPSMSVHGSTQTFAPSMPLRSVHTANYAAPSRVTGVSHLPTTRVPVPSTVVQGLTPAFMHCPTATYAPTYAPPMPLPLAHRVNYPAPMSLTAARSCTSCGASRGLNTEGFVQGLVTYTVRDDLTIAPKSIASITVWLNKLTREDKEPVLEEKTVQIGAAERKLIMKASLLSNTVLSDVFLPKQTTEASTSKNKRARDDIPDYYL